MSASLGVDLHPGAAEDFLDLWTHIAANNPAAAGRLVVDIMRAIERLPAFPHQGHRRTDLTSRPLRFIVVRDYLIAYAPAKRPIWIIAILHGRQDPRVMASVLRNREN